MTPASLITDLMEIGVADPAEEDFDLYVVFSGIASRTIVVEASADVALAAE